MSVGPEPRPCSGCARRVAYRKKWQQRTGKGGRSRVRHKCPHGNWCIFGEGAFRGSGWVWPECPECLKERLEEYDQRRKDGS